MQQTITLKIKLLVQPSELQTICNTMKAYSVACNFVSAYIFKTHCLTRKKIHDALYYKLREEFHMRSQMAESCIRNVITKYKTILSTENKWIQPSFKSQLELVYNRDYSLNIKKNLFSVNTLEGRIKVSFCNNHFEKYFAEEYQFGSAKLIEHNHKIFLYIPVTYDINVLDKKDVCNVVGIDRGIRFIAVTYDSKGKSKFYDGKEVKCKRAHYKNLRKELQQVGTASSRRRLKKIGQRENRWMQDVNHCISKALVESNPKGTLFILEDLSNIRKATEKVRLKNRYISVSWSYYDLEQKLIYKALRNHQLVEKVDAKYTSQTCPKCGHTTKSNRDKRLHRFCCKNCGYKSNDDRIGAMNLYRKGIELLSNGTVSTE